MFKTFNQNSTENMKKAKEFLRNKETFDPEYPTVSTHDAIEAMIEFAQYHIREALKTAQKKNGLLVDGKEYILDKFCIEKYDSFYSEVEITTKDVSNSYPLDLIS